MSSGKLFLVPTPIGNLGDITLRALDVLQNVDLVLAEDTRKSSILFKHYNIETRMESFHMHNEHKRLLSVLDRLKAGSNMALVSDAGTPGISDPGFLLTRAALENEVEVEALPGATAFVPALIKSGFPTERFVYEGFLPQKKGRKNRLEQISTEPRTVVLYESPHRILKLLKELGECLASDRRVSISRELTKKFEETITGNISEVIQKFDDRPTIKGEFVVVIESPS